MRTIDPAVAAQRARRGGLRLRHLVWIVARNRTTNAAEPLGLWDGADHREFTIRGQVRPYLGGGGLLELPDFTSRTGLDVWQPDMSVSGIAPEVEQILRGYDAKLARIEIHRADFDPSGGVVIGTPERVFKGWIDQAVIPSPEIGGEAVAALTLASNSRSLTRTLPARKSDEAYQRRDGDRIMRYADVSGSVSVSWGA